MTSDMWEHTAIFLTWDEWGGFYDPVAPPVFDDVGLGFRVPLLTISPYTPRGLIDTEVGEFSTPLRFISDNWGLNHLSPRIANTHDMSHMFDFKREAARPGQRHKQAGLRLSLPTQGFDGWQNRAKVVRLSSFV